MENEGSWRLLPTFQRRMERAQVEKENSRKARKRKRSAEIENNVPEKEEKSNFKLRIESRTIKTRKRKASTAAEGIENASRVSTTVPFELLSPPAVTADALTESTVAFAASLPLAPNAVTADAPTESTVTFAASVPLSPPAVTADAPTESTVAFAASVPLSPPAVTAAGPTESAVAFAASVPLSPPAMTADAPTESTVAFAASLPLAPPAVTADAPTESTVAFAASVPLSPPAVTADAPTESTVAFAASMPLSPPAVTAAAPTESTVAFAASVPLSPPAVTADAPIESTVAFAASVPLSPPAVTADAPTESTVAFAASVPLSPPAVTADAPTESTVAFAASVPLSPPAVIADAPTESTVAFAASVPLSPPAVTADAPTESTVAFAASVPLSPPAVTADAPTESTVSFAASVPLSPPAVTADAPRESTVAFAASVPLSLPVITANAPTETTNATGDLQVTSAASIPTSSSATTADASPETTDAADDLKTTFSTLSEPQVDSSVSSPYFSQRSCASRRSPLPSTSNSDMQQLILDLHLSDSDNSPYVDSESSYHPENNKTKSDSDTSQGETDDETNVRKRSKHSKPNTWKKNIAKNKRQRGLSYVNRKGNIVDAKSCVPTDCSKCRYKCNDNFPENVRKDLCHDFWGLGESKHQKIYLSTLIKHANIQRKTVSAKKQRAMSRQYFLCHKDTGKERVCQKFFCNTFCISASVIDTSTKYMGQSCIYIGDDQRKGLIPGNKTTEEAVNYVKLHIDVFPRIESHYCRKDSKKIYLESDLNMTRLYKLYKEEFCPEKNIDPVSSYVYENIFKSYDPPLAFYKPKKDQCTKCNVYRYSEDKTNLQRDYDEHKVREKESLDMKGKDKKESIESEGRMRAITFDLQAILSVPHTGDSKIYYLRKFSIYNFTILDSYKNTGLCYMWDESNGKKGSTEIGSALLKYLMDLPENVKTVSSFSDTCSGQNRNKYVTLAALYAVINVPHLETVNLKYMESGHSYLEADSIHASIERARKHKKIFTAREYALVISSARSKPKPYDVIVMKYPDFYDLKALEKSVNFNAVKNTNNEAVKWMSIKWIQVRKQSPGSIFYKYRLSDSTFEEIDITASKTKKKKGSGISHLYKPLKKAYKAQIPISKAKKKDLMTLLKDGVIPPDYADYYNNIPSIDEQNITNDCSSSESESND